MATYVSDFSESDERTDGPKKSSHNTHDSSAGGLARGVTEGTQPEHIYAVRNMPYEYEYRYRQFRTLRTVRVPYPRPMLLPGGGKPPPWTPPPKP